MNGITLSPHTHIPFLKKIFRPLAVCLLLSCFAGWTGCRNALDLLGMLHQYERIGDIDRTGLNEHSGIVFHPERGTLFLAGDEGYVYEITKEGELLHYVQVVALADFEGITMDPSTGLLYVAVEGEEKVLELDPKTLEMKRTFTLPRSFQDTAVLAEGGEGIEAITFLPDPDHPEGGTFLVANQSFTLDTAVDGSAVFEVVLPLRNDTRDVEITRQHSPGVVDLSGLCYDSGTDRILLISGSMNLLFELTRDFSIVSVRPLPGDNQEGITLDDEGILYIAQDWSGIIKYHWTW